LSSLKAYVKGLIDIVVNNTPSSQIAVTFYSGRNSIETTAFYSASNAGVLKTLVDDFNDYSGKTALYGATEHSLKVLKELDFEGGLSLISLCDGKDNDSDKPDSALSRIDDYLVTRYSIGIKNEGFKKEHIRNVSSRSSTCYVGESVSQIQEFTAELELQLTSKYNAHYTRSN